MHEQPGGRLGPSAAIAGAVLLFVGTYFHPMGADPNVPLAAFTEYAADRHWVASHLMQLLGIASMMAALVLLSRSMMDGPAAEWATLGMTGAVASLAVASALQAVDGVALKFMVDSWMATAEPGKAALFQAVFGVRQDEEVRPCSKSIAVGSAPTTSQTCPSPHRSVGRPSSAESVPCGPGVPRRRSTRRWRAYEHEGAATRRARRLRRVVDDLR